MEETEQWRVHHREHLKFSSPVEVIATEERINSVEARVEVVPDDFAIRDPIQRPVPTSKRRALWTRSSFRSKS